MTNETGNGRSRGARPKAAVALAAACVAVALILWPRAERLPDFSAYDDTAEMKQAFFAHLAPAVRAENRRVLHQRERLLEIVGDFERGGKIGWLERRWLRGLADEYALEWGAQDLQTTLELLQRRVDIVPLPLALVQAALESGWGRSRFAVEGNNLFGQWCYTPGCGLVPSRRDAGAGHEVADFDSTRAAVASYLHNLNTHDAYLPLRRLRLQTREARQAPRAEALVDGLIEYSERREHYVDEVRAALRINRPLIDEVVESA